MALITVTNLGDYLGQSLGASAKATFVVASADQIVKTLTEQSFDEVVDDVILMDGTGTETILLPELPVTDVSEVVENDEVLVENLDYVLTGDGTIARLPTVVEQGWSTATIRRRWPLGRRNIEITYTHGYASADLPDDLRMVALSIAARLFNESAGNVTEEELGQYRVRYSDSGSSDLTFTEKTIIRKYRVSTQTATSVAAS